MSANDEELAKCHHRLPLTAALTSGTGPSITLDRRHLSTEDVFQKIKTM